MTTPFWSVVVPALLFSSLIPQVTSQIQCPIEQVLVTEGTRQWVRKSSNESLDCATSCNTEVTEHNETTHSIRSYCNTDRNATETCKIVDQKAFVCPCLRGTCQRFEEKIEDLIRRFREQTKILRCLSMLYYKTTNYNTKTGEDSGAVLSQNGPDGTDFRTCRGACYLYMKLDGMTMSPLKNVTIHDPHLRAGCANYENVEVTTNGFDCKYIGHTYICSCGQSDCNAYDMDSFQKRRKEFKKYSVNFTCKSFSIEIDSLKSPIYFERETRQANIMCADGCYNEIKKVDPHGGEGTFVITGRCYVRDISLDYEMVTYDRQSFSMEHQCRSDNCNQLTPKRARELVAIWRKKRF